MAQQCEVCGKKPVLGNQVTHRGKAKYLGGVGTKVTGISRRKFRPNLQQVHVTTANGTRKTMRVCTQCIRSGAVTKRIQHNPFKLPQSSEVAGSGRVASRVSSSESSGRPLSPPATATAHWPLSCPSPAPKSKRFRCWPGSGSPTKNSTG